MLLSTRYVSCSVCVRVLLFRIFSKAKRLNLYVKAALNTESMRCSGCHCVKAITRQCTGRTDIANAQ